MTTYHMRLDIKGFLLNNHHDKDFEGIFRHDNGREMDAEEARRMMLDKLSQGVKFLPASGCDNFDQEKGCLGHPDD
jgi:hypothetical protein